LPGDVEMEGSSKRLVHDRGQIFNFNFNRWRRFRARPAWIITDNFICMA
jgi:hypothetical protein